MPITAGETLNNRYRIVKLLGEGGFGAVYRAWDLSLKHPCALKENLEVSPEAQRQFEREATVLAQLTHPNLPRVTDHFVIPGQGQYLVMDFIEGIDLATLVASQGAVTPHQAIHWISQIADALVYLHSQHSPVIHRDIKPANIRIKPDGTAVLVDFGLVKLYNPQQRTTMGARAVTPGYAPPEQYGQGATDPRTDMYALAATLYTLVTGSEPPESVQRMAGTPLTPVTQMNSQVLPTTSRVIERAMALKPADRYPTVRDFKAALLATVSRPVAAPPPMQVMPTELAQPYPMTMGMPAAPAVSTGSYAKRGAPAWLLWLTVPLALIGVLAILFGGGYLVTIPLRPTPTPIIREVEVVVVATPDRDATREAEETQGALLATQAALEAASTEGSYELDAARAQITADASYIHDLEIALAQAYNLPTPTTVGSSTACEFPIPIAINDNPSNSLSAGALHCYQFYGYTNQAVAILVDGGFDSFLELYDTSMVQLAFNDDGGAGLNSLLTFTPSYDGTYYLILRGFSTSSSGDYSLYMYLQPTDSAFSYYTYLESGIRTRYGITSSSMVRFESLNETQYGVMFYVELFGGTTIQVDVFANSIGSQIDPVVEIYGPDGIMYAYDDDSGTGLDSLLIFTAPISAPYYILVRSLGDNYGSDATHFFEVLMTEIVPTPAP